MKDKISEGWKKIASYHPLIFHLTNGVTMNFSANVCSATGASPVMSLHPEEADVIAGKAHGIVVNTGTPGYEGLKAMDRALKVVCARDKPILLDPVGYGLTPFRTKVIDKLLAKYRFSIIKGNSGEMSLLAGNEGKTLGVDSVYGADPVKTVSKVAERYGCVAVITGKKDFVSNGRKVFEHKGGSLMLGKITGGGCVTGSVLCACAAACGDSLVGAMAGLAAVGIAAEGASRDSCGLGSFAVSFVDHLSSMAGRPLCDLDERIELKGVSQ